MARHAGVCHPHRRCCVGQCLLHQSVLSDSACFWMVCLPAAVTITLLFVFCTCRTQMRSLALSHAPSKHTLLVAPQEGLPAAVTITLSYGTNLMSKKNAQIMDLHAVETLGAARCVCVCLYYRSFVL